MTSKSIIDMPPNGLLRAGLRLPIWLYRGELGWLLGDRFLMLTHTGRRSGRAHETVIEVVRHDRQADTYYVVSGWGEKSDWYQNIRKSPSVTIQAGGRKLHAIAPSLFPWTRQSTLWRSYARKHPTAFRELSGLFLSERLQPGSDAPRRLSEKMPMVAFHVHS